jgi:hypothetical protein
MRALVALFIALPITLGASGVAMAADEECFIGDSALCLANPKCHWDGEKRGCYPGPAEYQDVCAVHADQSVCDKDTTLGCKWSADANKCETKIN